MRSTEETTERRYEVFLCHNRRDKPVVKDIADAMQFDASVLFFLDEYAIPASVEFFRFIEAEMLRAASYAIFIGPSGWGPTHIQEAKLALRVKEQREDFRIIPVALPGCSDTAWGELFGTGSTPTYNGRPSRRCRSRSDAPPDGRHGCVRSGALYLDWPGP